MTESKKHGYALCTRGLLPAYGSTGPSNGWGRISNLQAPEPSILSPDDLDFFLWILRDTSGIVNYEDVALGEDLVLVAARTG